MKYDIWCGKCSSGIKCEIYNGDTEERITIDESYEDVIPENWEQDLKDFVRSIV